MDHFIPMLVKNISNRCYVKMYYINCLTHKNCRSITTSCSTGQLTNKLRFCSHMLVVLTALVFIFYFFFILHVPLLVVILHAFFHIYTYYTMFIIIMLTIIARYYVSLDSLV